jgi:hypothetical protein
MKVAVHGAAGSIAAISRDVSEVGEKGESTL